MKISNTNSVSIARKNYNEAMDELSQFQRESARKLKELKDNQMKTWAILIREEFKSK